MCTYKFTHCFSTVWFHPFQKVKCVVCVSVDDVHPYSRINMVLKDKIIHTDVSL